STLESLPPGVRIANAVVSYATYLTDVIWPARLTVFYPLVTDVHPIAVAIAAAVLVVITVGVGRVAAAAPFALVGWFWYLATLLPVIGLTQVGLQAKADRFTYVPLVGIFVIVAWGVPALAARWPGVRTAVALAGAAAVAACAIVSHRQAEYWQDSLVLWE